MPTYLVVPGRHTRSCSCLIPAVGCSIKADILCRAALKFLHDGTFGLYLASNMTVSTVTDPTVKGP